MSISKVFVIGAGIMGSGIAQVCAEAGIETYICDINETLVEKGINNIKNNLERAVSKGKMSEARKDEIMKNLVGTIDMSALSVADFVVEAVTENVRVKEEVFRKMDTLCKIGAVLATNTSSISITKLASVTKRPQWVIGTHFFNPVPVMRIVEVIRGMDTSDETVSITLDFAKQINKEVVFAKDYPAFLLNRMLLPMLNEAFYCLMEGQGTAEDIDRGMKLAMGHPMGPLELADLIGLDTLLLVFEVMYEGYGDPKYFPCPLLRKMVEAGRLGRKSGRGFYEYVS